jgi:hypothetical protein
MRTHKIETIKGQYRREWLLIDVDKIDKSTTTPVSGRLIAHSPHRDEIYKRLFSMKNRRHILVEYSEDSLPKGYAAAFRATP